MILSQFLALPPAHDVTFAEGQALLADIAKNDLPSLSDENAEMLLDYISLNLLHESVSPDLVPELEAKLALLEKTN